MEPPSSAAAASEAERLLTIASKLLHSDDLTGAKEFAILAQETDPLLDGSDQIIAVSDVLLAAEKDHYSVLQLDPTADKDAVRRHYRRLALLLHPDKNPSPLAESAFRHVSDAWAVLSDPTKKAEYDKSIGVAGKSSIYSKVNLREVEPMRRVEEVAASFWTACPYCYNLYEYLKVYEDCCLRCQNCKRAFHGVAMPSLPPFVPGREAYYCTWNPFPLQPAVEGLGKPHPATGTGNWRPANMPETSNSDGGSGSSSSILRFATPSPSGKKRGRPKRYPLEF